MVRRKIRQIWTPESFDNKIRMEAARLRKSKLELLDELSENDDLWKGLDRYNDKKKIKFPF